MKKSRMLLLAICSVVFIYSAYNLISYYYDAYINAKTYNKVKDLYIPAEVVIEDAQGETEEDIEARLQALREENFRKLREVNKDIVAWIYVPGTNVDYPVVHGEDNSYYLNHDIEGKTSRAGAIFLDYRITVNEDSTIDDINTVIYGHHMKNGSMFASLKRYKDSSFLEENPYIYLDTVNGRRKYQIFSVFVTKTDFQYTKINFSSDNEYLQYLQEINNKSMNSTNIELKSTDKIITLSTCTYEFDGSRLAVIGRLVE